LEEIEEGVMLIETKGVDLLQLTNKHLIQPRDTVYPHQGCTNLFLILVGCYLTLPIACSENVKKNEKK
tara:strand:- start:198 stop:401 length:204 start_codon:yes stop_codon:yes gene_type:complete